MASLVRWEPFRELISLRDAVDRMFDEIYAGEGDANRLSSLHSGVAAVDMYETNEAVVVECALPGVRSEDVDIRLVGDVLTISGVVSSDENVSEGSYIRRERRCCSFHRSVSVPVLVVADRADAVMENGVLTLTLPKAEEVRPRLIKVVARDQ